MVSLTTLARLCSFPCATLGEDRLHVHKLWRDERVITIALPALLIYLSILAPSILITHLISPAYRASYSSPSLIYRPLRVPSLNKVPTPQPGFS
jgi:hypothetical protein